MVDERENVGNVRAGGRRYTANNMLQLTFANMLQITLYNWENT